MAALLVAISIMAVMLGAAMPTWSMMIRREKEEELIFRGKQYARAIDLYQRKYASASPADLDVLIKERLLRKKFKDPLSPNKDGEFQLCRLSSQMAAARGGPNQDPQNPGSRNPGSRNPGTQTPNPQNLCAPDGRGPITGVASKNTGPSIRVLNGKTKYNEWVFEGIQQSAQAGAGPGAGGPGAGGPGGVGGPGGRGQGGRGQGNPPRGTSTTTPDGGTTFTTFPRGGRRP